MGISLLPSIKHVVMALFSETRCRSKIPSDQQLGEEQLLIDDEQRIQD
jgi:hypothetical protein